MTAATQTDDESDQSASLMSFLKHFNQNRHHVTYPEGKQKARDFIKKTFQELNLTTWSEKFKPDFPQVKIMLERRRHLLCMANSLFLHQCMLGKLSMTIMTK